MLKQPVMPNKDAPRCIDCKHFLKLQRPIPCLPCGMTPNKIAFKDKRERF